MIQQLRRKFVVINMALVSLVLLIVFSALYYSTYRRLQAESFEALFRAITRDDNLAPGKVEIGGRPPKPKPLSMFAVFVVTLDTDHRVRSVTGENVQISDEVLNEAVKRAMASAKPSGNLASLQLRFLREPTSGGTKIAFADLSSEHETMTNLLTTSLLVGCGGLSAFFLISLFLSRLALRPAEKAWEQQKQLVADASHELRTPITVILTNTRILLSHRQETIDRQVKWVEYIQAEAERMKKLVDDLLFLAKSDDAQAPMVRSEFDFSDAVWNCVLPFESVAYERGITLNTEITPEIVIQGDAGQLKQLVVILLDNACKHAGQNEKVTLSLDRQQDKARLMVTNTGTPIPPEHLEHIFERFYRADKSRARSEGGYGLGLAIAKSIVDNHRGKITVDSNAQTGTTFGVTLPVK